MGRFSLGSGKFGTALTIASILIACAVGLFVLVAALASYTSTHVENGWEETLGSREEIFWSWSDSRHRSESTSPHEDTKDERGLRESNGLRPRESPPRWRTIAMARLG